MKGRKKPLLAITLFFLLSMTNMSAQTDYSSKIWDAAPHNAFPDIRYYDGYFYIVFRESNMHVHKTAADDGKIRVLRSFDGKNWISIQLLEKPGFDLRDPMLEITSDNRLMLLMGGSVYDKTTLTGAHTHVSFLENGRFTGPVPVRYSADVDSSHNWLWSVTWNNGIGYGVVYQFEPNKPNKLMLVKTGNAVDYSLVANLEVAGRTSESKAVFVNDNEMIMVIRRDGDPKTGVFGKSRKPFTDWTFKEMDIQLGGPHLIRFSKDLWLLSTRSFTGENPLYTGIYLLNTNGETKKLFQFPEDGRAGDCSYPGMEIHNGNLYVCYYSSHDGKTNIYLATIPIKKIKKVLKDSRKE